MTSSSELTAGSATVPRAGVDCPSGRARAGSLLIGMRDQNGRVRHLRSPITVGPEMEQLTVPESAPPLEMYLRFSEPCARQHCGHWAADRCGLVDALIDEDSPTDRDRPDDGRLSPCGIRRSCVWFAQRGTSACGSCDQVTRAGRQLSAGPAQPAEQRSTDLS